MKYHFCTCFDNNYLIYGYTLYQSLKKHVEDFTIYIVCLDEMVFQNLKQLNLPEADLIPLSDIESFDPEYAATAATRSRVEYIFTLSPVMPLYILKHHPEIDILAYTDSDLYFFSSPARLYQELGNQSVLIFEHDFYTEESLQTEKYGRFNMAFQLYRNDSRGIACLKHWRQECLDWCFDRPENGKFADQKYLEEWPELFQAVIASNHSGGGLAPWNCGKHQFDFSGIVPKVDNQPVIFYHYQGCKLLKYNILLISQAPYYFYISTSVSNFFYSCYYNAMIFSRKRIEKVISREKIQTVYLFKREKKEFISPRKQSAFSHWISSIRFHLPLLLCGQLAYQGRRIAPLIFALFYYKKTHK